MNQRWVQIYMDVNGYWRWRVHSGNGHILAESGEGYRDRIRAVRMAESLFPDLDVTIA